MIPEEHQEIIDAVIAKIGPILHAAICEQVEKAYLAMPETIGALMAQHASLLSINKKFYGEHPDFTKHKSIVQSVVEQLEGQTPLAKYEDLLKKAVPLIQERIAIQAGVDMTTVKRPDRHLPGLSISVERDPHGPHGAL